MGGCSLALNAACAALVDAGVPMSALLAAASCARTGGGELLLDPTAREEAEASSSSCFAFCSRIGLPEDAAEADEEGVVLSTTRGLMGAEDYIETVAAARRASSRVAGFARASLARSSLAF